MAIKFAVFTLYIMVRVFAAFSSTKKGRPFLAEIRGVGLDKLKDYLLLRQIMVIVPCCGFVIL